MQASFRLLRCIAYILTSCVICQGCVTSTYVSSIGAHVQTGSTDVTDEGIVYKVTITDHQLAPSDIENSGVTIPFLTLMPKEPGTVIGEGWIKPTEVKWTKIDRDWKEGYIPVYFQTEAKTFKATTITIGAKTEHGHIQIQNKYRRWYSYPSQLLLVCSIPIDAVIDMGTMFVTIFNKIVLI
ncbi:MAG: hypothetical protein CXR31_14540 [Geobacter sp.]|nr:MAG: hypothetical protein CXR31_14540 [Geobacter sp.]